MRATKGFYVVSAFNEIGIADYNFDVTVDEKNSALRRLDSMMAEWHRKGIKLGWPLPGAVDSSDTSDETNSPDWATEAIITNLAIRIGPGMGKAVPLDTKVTASKSYNHLLTSARKLVSKRTPAGIPAGAGHKSSLGNNFIDPSSDDIVEKPEETMEFEL